MLCPRDSVWPTKVGWAPKHFSMYWYDTRCFWDCCTRVATLLSPLNNWISTLWLKKGPWCHRKPNVQVEGAYNGARQLQPCVSSETSAEGHEVSSCPGRWERRRHACLSSCQWGALPYWTFLYLRKHGILTEKRLDTTIELQAFKKARSLGLGDQDFSAVYEVVKGAGGSGSGQAWWNHVCDGVSPFPCRFATLSRLAVVATYEYVYIQDLEPDRTSQKREY